MDVRHEPLPGDLPILRLIADENRPDIQLWDGCTVGYLCLECHQMDEDVDEILHLEDCPLAGEHGRKKYDDLPRVDHHRARDQAVLQEDTNITILQAAWTDRSQDIYHDDVLGFRCDECSNCDETIFEVVHDERCGVVDAFPLHC